MLLKIVVGLGVIGIIAGFLFLLAIVPTWLALSVACVMVCLPVAYMIGDSILG